MESEFIYGLVCTGGGAHGAYQVGVLKYIHEHFCKSGKSPFRIYTGVSCGSLNTTFYAAESYRGEEARFQLEDLWLNFHVPAYHGNTFKNAFLAFYKNWKKPADEKRPTWALLDPSPMNAVVKQGFSRSNLLKSFAEKSTLGVGIAATELISGRACWFLEGPNAKSWNLFHSLGIRNEIKWQHLSASCSVPIFLPAVRVGQHYFLDGSIAMDKPLSAAITMGANRILTIATDKPYPADLPTYGNNFKPRLSNVIRLLLNRLSQDAAGNEAAEIHTFNRFYKALSRKNRNNKGEVQSLPLFHNEAKPSHYQHTEVLRIIPSQRIRQTGHVDNAYKGMRKKTRFMFHKNFIQELIELGYEDAQNQHASLEGFFRPAPPAPGKMGFLRKLKR